MKYLTTRMERSVELLYRRLGIVDPDHPIEDIALKLNIDLLHCADLNLSTSNQITLDTFLPKNKMKEVFAHELCHVLYHAGIQLNIPEQLRELQEWGAHNFSLHFCVPTFMLREIDLPKNRGEAASVVSDSFGVTNEFAAERLDRYKKQIDGSLFHAGFTSLMITQDKQRQLTNDRRPSLR